MNFSCGDSPKLKHIQCTIRDYHLGSFNRGFYFTYSLGYFFLYNSQLIHLSENIVVKKHMKNVAIVMSLVEIQAT